MSRARVGCGLGLALVIGAGCAHLRPTPRAYTLTLDVAQPARSRLCWREVTSATVAADAPLPAERCQAWGTQDLDAPGTLALELDGQRLGERYDLRIAQFSRGASAEDAQQLLQEIITRGAGLLSTWQKSLGGGIAATVGAVADRATADAPQLGAKIAEALRAQAAAAPPPAPPAVRFDGYLVVDKGVTVFATPEQSRAAAGDEVVPDYNAPANPPPPPRVYRFDAADLAYLAEKKVDRALLVAHVAAWCSVGSFQTPAFADRYAALATMAVDLDVLRSALDLSANDLLALLLDEGSLAPLDARLATLVAAGRDWATASAAARSYYLLRFGTSLRVFTDNCIANLAFLGQPVPDELRTLQAQAAAQAVGFAKVLGPIYAEGLRLAEQTLVAGLDGSLGTITLEPGRLELGVGVVEGTKPRREVATYKAEVLGIERLALVVGPMVSACRSGWACFDKISDYTDDSGRHLVRQRDQFDVAMATALHITFAASSRDGLGAVVGYPLSTPSTTSSNLLFGLGYRHRSGLEVVAGVHAFRTAVLLERYRSIDLATLDNTALTVDAVTEDRVRASAFLMVGFAPNLLGKLN